MGQPDKVKVREKEGKNAREPVCALASIAGAHERVNDRVAFAQVVRIVGTGRANIGVVSLDQRRDRKCCLSKWLVESFSSPTSRNRGAPPPSHTLCKYAATAHGLCPRLLNDWGWGEASNGCW